ncbi:MAG: hypothetical protein AAFQ45_13195 [Pseudomonadota bacterium]
MSGADQTSGKLAKRAAGADREVRLAAALRENLQKRKAQARARRETDAAQAEAGAPPRGSDTSS